MLIFWECNISVPVFFTSSRHTDLDEANQKTEFIHYF